MIYTKKANFPYPVLMNFTDDYVNSEFEFDVELKDNAEEYILNITWSVSSEFMDKIIEDGLAELILIIQSKDNQFHKLKSLKEIQHRIKKNRLTLNARTVMQLMLISKEDISFKDNNDLNEFYNENKEEIIVPAGHVLGFSNTVIFDGSQEKPYELFEKRVDPELKSDIEIEIGDETIIIAYKDQKFQFADMPYGKALNYPYIYLGLQKALNLFIIHQTDDNNDPEDGVCLDDMTPPDNPLEFKLYTLMQAKDISELNFDNMDEVIYQISDNMVGRYSDTVRRLQNGD